MPKLNEAQDREHPWFKKSAQAGEAKTRKVSTTSAPKAKQQGCVQCGEVNCEFGECAGGDF